MTFKIEDDRDANLFLAGTTVGGILIGLSTFVLMRQMQKEYAKRLVENITLKTELLNWVLNDGIDLDRWEFEREFKDKARFIMLSENARRQT